MKWLIGFPALVSVAVLVAAGGSSRHMNAPLRQRIVAVARRAAHQMDDSAPVKTVLVYGPASYRVALSAFGGGVTTPNQKKGRFYVIAVRGRFVCASCPRPALASGQPGPSPRGSIVTRLWSPTGGGGGIGLSKKLPASMARLGRPARISLH